MAIFLVKTGRKQKENPWAFFEISCVTFVISDPLFLFCFLYDDASRDTCNFQRNIHVQNPYFLISLETLCLSLFCISFCKRRRRKIIIGYQSRLLDGSYVPDFAHIYKSLGCFWPALKFIEALIFRMQTTTSDVTVFFSSVADPISTGLWGARDLGTYSFLLKIVIGSKKRNRIWPTSWSL